MTDQILVLNAGSSSIKFALFDYDDTPVELARGQMSGIGVHPRLVVRQDATTARDEQFDHATIVDHHAALGIIIDDLHARLGDITIEVVGHRVVHGGAIHAAPAVIDDALVTELAGLCALAPLHQPHNLDGIAAARDHFPDALQVACFDTAFHRSHPWVADAFALPRALYDQGVRRYGFHGISYEYVSDALRQIDPAMAAGRVVIAHLGAGASMCAVHGGRSIDSTMGFTALDGLPMGTRCGQIDPGVILHLIQQRGMSAEAVTRLLYHDSGLLGLSGISSDMRDLEGSDSAAARQAIDYFVHHVRREIGALAAALGGLDALVFTAGIGENAAAIRAAVCRDMAWLGIALDGIRNAAGERLISGDGARVRVFVIPTDEEVMIARHAGRLLRAATP
ncbi:acetate/propionate family kinase [Parapedomonas caeni]